MAMPASCTQFTGQMLPLTRVLVRLTDVMDGKGHDGLGMQNQITQNQIMRNQIPNIDTRKGAPSGVSLFI